MTRSIETMLTWWGTPAEVHLSLNREFIAPTISPAQVREWLGLYQAKVISYETLYSNLIQADIVRAGVAAEEEKSDIEQETEQPASRARGVIDDGDQADPNAG